MSVRHSDEVIRPPSRFRSIRVRASIVQPSYHASVPVARWPSIFRHPPRLSGITMIVSARSVRARTYIALIICTLGASLLATRLSAQSASELVTVGDRESIARHPVLALEHYERALQLEPRNYDALCKASREAADLGEADANAGQRASL